HHAVHALIFHGGNNGHVHLPGAQCFGAERRHGERKIVAALKRSVREAPDKRRRIQEFDDGDAQFAHGPYIVVRYKSASTATLRRRGPLRSAHWSASKYSTHKRANPL